LSVQQPHPWAAYSARESAIQSVIKRHWGGLSCCDSLQASSVGKVVHVSVGTSCDHDVPDTDDNRRRRTAAESFLHV
jgi:hypothetical protein